MVAFDLNGKWELEQVGTGERINATVPGFVHTDLLAAKKIQDPFYRDRELELQWIGEKDWIYSKTFIVSAALLDHDLIQLECQGLDTFAQIKVNGKSVGSTDNMFRVWDFSVGHLLKKGQNRIEIRFRSTYPRMKQGQKERHLWLTGVGHHRIDGSNWIRKCQCHYGWDWGPMLVPAGIWRPIRLAAYDGARLTDVHIAQKHTRGRVDLSVTVATAALERKPTEIDVVVSLGAREVTRVTAPVVGKKQLVELRIDKPALWWPAGMGAQPLYDVRVTLRCESVVLDEQTRSIGLRTLRLERKPDRWGESFQFVANGRPFFAKGANWIPADSFTNRITPERYEDLLESARDANMNMLRVWGGGIYEEDVFYRICDEKGLCVWQDFMFACAAYPTFDDQWMATVKEEVRDNVRRLRHHPSIALWCGNNEIEQIKSCIGKPEDGGMTWAEYKNLFDRAIPGILSQEDPERDYWPSSEHSPLGDREDSRNPRWGDAHLWDVWHGRKPFEWYRTCEHRFNSEFGFQSFAEPNTTYTYTEPEDRNITSYVMELHQRSPIGNSAIIDYMLSWFRLPVGFDNTLWLSQILQGMAIKYAVEHWRRSMPQGMGTLYWQLNDCWPVASWSSIDYFHRWKALHFMARRFFAPALVSAVEDLEKGTCELWVTSDMADAVDGTIRWKLTDTAGKKQDGGEVAVTIGPDRSRRAATLKLKETIERIGSRNALLWMDLLIGGRVVSDNFVSFVRPKHIDLSDPGLTATSRKLKDGGFVVKVRAQRPALWVWPELKGVDARYSDRFFHLSGNQSHELIVRPTKDLTPAAFTAMLGLRSLRDTYQEV